MTQFTFYEIYKDVMEMLDDDTTRGQFMKAICRFMFEEEPVKPPKGNKPEYFWENIIDVMTESKEAEKNGKPVLEYQSPENFAEACNDFYDKVWETEQK